MALNKLTVFLPLYILDLMVAGACVCSCRDGCNSGSAFTAADCFSVNGARVSLDMSDHSCGIEPDSAGGGDEIPVLDISY